jgi:Asp-tRNA(Asn)/Glu-tRNA(Gln) amidotransferase A subunit family amidase
VNLRAIRIAIPRPDYWERDDVDPGVADVVRGAFAKLRDAGCTLVEIDLDGELRGIVGTIFQPTPAAMYAGDGMDAPVPTSLTMAAWLRENAPDVTVEQMYRDRPIRDTKRTFPPMDEQVRALKEAAQRYARSIVRIMCARSRFRQCRSSQLEFVRADRKSRSAS